jgi:hypothetical protein
MEAGTVNTPLHGHDIGGGTCTSGRGEVKRKLVHRPKGSHCDPLDRLGIRDRVR